MTTAEPEQRVAKWRPRVTVSRGLVTITLALLALIVACVGLAPTSISQGALLGMLLPAALLALGAVSVAGLLNGFLIGRLRLNPIVATLGTNALLYAGVLQISGGIPRSTTTLLANVAGGVSFGIPNAVYFAIAAT